MISRAFDFLARRIDGPLAAVLEAWGDAQDHFLAVQVAEARLRLLDESLAVTRRFLGLAESRLKVGEAIRLAGELGVRTVDLTSRPSRTAANALYEKIGFHMRESNVYRYEPR